MNEISKLFLDEAYFSEDPSDFVVFFCNDGAMNLHLFGVLLRVSLTMSSPAMTTQKLNRQRLDVLFQISGLVCHCSDSFNQTAFLNFSFFLPCWFPCPRLFAILRPLWSSEMISDAERKIFVFFVCHEIFD